ncbi:sensor histidine kinase [Ramlibacter tataouinensis]|uniref:histidine kinase n=1 Tax=Ramlibacter tataouinensis (strain ATCC BAA-407 / DSM 14655 / LMG 21543 / TTB310) TaxID=365046 RepID=F5Y3X9_RAMTT|nr:HAMP domain-containing sensor histidine kinase [Ramlibacter tataouinensis]AEG91257.1 candidate histidine kinase, classic [Ramlibacter tataouinensis TTB310]
MAAWQGSWRFPLYLRLWLAVIAAVAIITVAFGWLWRMNNQQAPMRDVIIRDDASGQVLGQARTRPVRTPGQGVEFEVAMNDGRTLVVQIPPRTRSPGEGPPSRPWARGTSGLLWMLGIMALAVVIGSYPIIRRLTQRLESLRRGVERWGEGDLAVRVDESGSDEAAFLARRFNHAAERLETLIKSHKSLLANASHELRSPLARIRMGIELMGGDSPAAKAEITRNIAELDQLIDEILLASRLDARATDVGTPEPVDLAGLAAEESARAGAELVTEGSGPFVVEGVAKLLRRAIRNLLENARRYADGPVQVEVAPAGGDMVVRVRDQGPGVPPDQRERIFEPFYRLPGASEREGGVGLGLALVRSIAQRHHGRAVCEDAPGGGACFVLRLPRRQP